MRGLDYQTPSRPRVDPIGTPLAAREYERNQFTVFLDAYFEVGRYRLATVDPPPHINTIKNIWHRRLLDTILCAGSNFNDVAFIKCFHPAAFEHRANSYGSVVLFQQIVERFVGQFLKGCHPVARQFL